MSAVFDRVRALIDENRDGGLQKNVDLAFRIANETPLLLDEAERLLGALKKLMAKTENYFEEHGAVHENPECPQDDTCQCPLVCELNEAFAEAKLCT